MIRCFILACITFTTLAGGAYHAAAQHYLLSTGTHNYIELVDPVVLHVGNSSMAPSYTIDVPIPINGFGKFISAGVSNSVIIEAGFGAFRVVSPTSDTMFSVDAFVSNGLFPSTPQSRLSYVVEGAGETAQLTIEWKDFSILGGNTMTDTVSFQIRIGATGIVEILFGRVAIGSSPSAIFIGGSPGPSIGAFMSDESLSMIMHSYFLTGTPTAPFPDTEIIFAPLNGIPSSGTIYRFTPAGSVSVDDVEEWITVAPNPADEFVVVEASAGKQISNVVVTDVTGATINIPLTMTHGEHYRVTLDVSDQPPGLIVLSCKVGNEHLVRKVLVQ